MTTITYYEGKDEISIEIKGHCGYAEEGSDIVCSAVSMLAQTLVSYLIAEGDDVRYTIRSGYVWCYSKGDKAKQAMKVIMCGYYRLAENYPDYVELVKGCSIQANSA